MTDTRPLFTAAPQAVLDAVNHHRQSAIELVANTYSYAWGESLRETPDAEAINDSISAAAQIAAEAVAAVCRLTARTKEKPLGVVASVMLVDIDMRARGIIIKETRG